MAMIDIPVPLRQRIRTVQLRLQIRKGRAITIAEALEYLLDYEDGKVKALND